MAKVIRDRGASGHGSIMFRQDLAYPRVPEQITFYPPEPSEELQKQVARDKAGGIGLYIIGFFTALLGFMAALNYSSNMEIYSTLIPFLLILGLVFAILYLILNNVMLAKLSRVLPLILLVALLLIYILSILLGVIDFQGIQEPPEGASDIEIQAFEQEMEAAFENLVSIILNPAFFFLLAGLIIARAGGTMLWASTRVVHEYIPGMIILEVPGYQPPQEYPEEGMGEDAEEASCASCGGPLTFIEEYGRWYCYKCEAYAPRSEDVEE